MKQTQSMTESAIRASAAAVEASLTAREPKMRAAVEALRGRRRVWLAGSGTSYHASIVGRHLLRTAGFDDARVVQAFELAAYPPALGKDDAVIVVSHSGAKRYSRDAIRLARDAGALTLVVTGIGGTAAEADHHLETVPQESSQAHTVSFSGALVTLARLARGAGAKKPAWSAELDRAPETLKAILAREAELDAAAAKLAPGAQLVFVGGGPNRATALEGALKAQEMTHLPARGFELETSLHGPLVSINKGDLLVVPVARGAAQARSAQLLRAASEVGATCWPLGQVGKQDGFAVEGLDEAWSPFALCYSLQIFMLKLAARLGVNPDTNRRDDPAYERAFQSYQG